MLYTLKKGEYPEGHRYWSNATADLTAPFTEIWVVMPWDGDADAFHEVVDWLDSRCRFNE